MARSDRKQIRPQFVGGIPGHVLDADYFYPDTTDPDPADIVITCGGWERCAPDFDIQRASYPYWFVIYTLGGRGTLQAGDKTWTLTPGMLSGFAPGSPHHYCANPLKPMEQIFITFQGSQAADLFTQSGLGREPAQRVTDAPTVLGLFEQFLQTGLDHGPRAQAICGNYLRIILLKLMDSSVDNGPQRPGAWQTYQTCRRYLNTHFTLIKGPLEAAEACNIDVRYLAALFKRFGTTSPQRYLLRLKLSRAADLLLTTPLSITEVAGHVGFQDPYHFSRRFKQFHGCSPKQYRKNHL
ncbi:AraC family transcriptional regulator [Planctomycetota bacterium]